MKTASFSISTLFTVWFILFLTCAFSFAGDANIRIAPPDHAVSAGESFRLNVIIDTLEPVHAYQFEIRSLDPSVLEIEGVEAGPDGFVTASSLDEASGMLKVNGFVAEDGVSGADLRFLTLRLVAKAHGEAALDIRPVIFAGATGDKIKTTAAGINVDIERAVNTQ